MAGLKHLPMWHPGLTQRTVGLTLAEAVTSGWLDPGLTGPRRGSATLAVATGGQGSESSARHRQEFGTGR